MTTGMRLGNMFDFLCTINCFPGQTVKVDFKNGVTPPTYYTSYNGAVSGTNTYGIQRGNASVPAATGAGTGWTLAAVGDGSFNIIQGGQYLTAGSGDAGRAWGAGVTLAAPMAASATGPDKARQQWFIEPIKTIGGAAAPANRYRLVNRYSELVLSFTTGGLTSANLAQAVLVPPRDWDAAAGSAYTQWHVADQTLILVAQ